LSGLSPDFTGRTWTREAEHPYLENLAYFGFREEQKCYWEAELPLPDSQGRASRCRERRTGPLETVETFSQMTLRDLDRQGHTPPIGYLIPK
jgi:hypothetical protein